MKCYMVLDYADGRSIAIKGTPDCGVEYLGHCSGRIITDEGILLGEHHSSTIDFLRMDLRSKLAEPEAWEIIDLIGEPCPDRFRKAPDAQ